MGKMTMKIGRLRSSLLCAGILGLTLGCAVHPVREEVRAPATVPERYSVESPETQAPGRWWETFDDEELNAHVDRALEENLDIRTAWARLDQVRALAVKAGAESRPWVSTEQGISRSRTEMGRAQTSNLFTFGLSASYEIDLWKRIESQQKAVALDVRVSQEEVEATAIGLAAQVVRNWYSLAEQRAQLQLLNEQIRISETFLELVELRFGQGLSTAVDVFQQREQLASLRTQVPLVESSIEVLTHQLAILLGQPPLTEVGGNTDRLPPLSPLPEVGIPMQLLRQRPDLRASATRISAADYRIAVAVADQFPALRLRGGTGFQGTETGDFFSNWLWNLAANATTPLVDGGLRVAEVERTKAVIRERLLDYEKRVLLALQEVEDALVRERQQQRHVELVVEQIEFARSAFEESRARFASGGGNYLPVLTALQALQRSERSLLTERRKRVDYRIDLHKALGGSWTAALRRTADSESANSASTDIEASQTDPVGVMENES